MKTKGFPGQSCGGITRILDTRLYYGGRAIKRRRACVACEERLTTYETTLNPFAATPVAGELPTSKQGEDGAGGS